jgi:hypothetical protein
MRNPGKYMLAAAIVVSVLVAAPLALGAGEGRPVDGGARNPSNDPSQNYTRETQIISNVSTYGTRQSNKSTTGGGAIYGCRAASTSSNTCVRATNLSNGQAFSFSTNGGNQVGSITSSNRSAAPFTTNATGVATGLNADQVDGQSASEIVSSATTSAVASANLFARVGGAAGTLGANRGATGAARDALGNYRVGFTANISSCAWTATAASGATPITATVEAVAGNVNQVRVQTFGETAGALTAADSDFHLTVTC